MYKIIGADGRQYGPISAEQLRRWIAEGRANAHTQTLADGASEWKPLGAQPEFAGHFAPQIPPPIASLRPHFPGELPQTTSFATAGFILGIVSLTCVFCCGGFPLNVLALIFSIIALMQISEHPELYKGRGLAVAGVILASVSLLILLLAMAAGHTNVTLNGRQF